MNKEVSPKGGSKFEESARTRNIGIMAHVDSGKTTLTERILLHTNKIRRVGEVHEGATQMDWMKQERERGITIQSAATFFNWGDGEFTLIDTPGHIDFSVEVHRSAPMIDGGIILLDGVAGVEPQTKSVWRVCKRHEIPVICMVNKMDRVGADYPRCVKELETNFSDSRFVVFASPDMEDPEVWYELLFRRRYTKDGYTSLSTLPQGLEEYRSQMVERIILTDDALIEQSLENVVPSDEVLIDSMRRAVCSRQLIPIMGGSAIKNIGVNMLLDSVLNYLPSPLESHGIQSKLGDTQGHMFSVIFKLQHIPQVGILYYLRVLSGVLRVNSTIYNLNLRERMRVGRVIRLHAVTMHDLKEAHPGDLVAITLNAECRTGDTLCDSPNLKTLELAPMPEPVVSVKLIPEDSTTSYLEKLAGALRFMTLADPSLHYQIKKIKHGMTEHQEHVLRGVGELQLDIARSVLDDTYGVKVKLGEPNVEYRAHLKESRDVEYLLKKQSGGAGLWARVFVKFDPLGSDQPIAFKSTVTGGKISIDCIPAVEEGIRYEADFGVAGWPSLYSFQATLYDGDMHPVDSKKKAFELAGRGALNKACRDNMIIYEPIMLLNIVVSNAYIGDVTSDLGQRRGEVIHVDHRELEAEIVAKVPLGNLFGYVTTLRSFTSGNGSVSYEFDSYSELPQYLYSKVFTFTGWEEDD